MRLLNVLLGGLLLFGTACGSPESSSNEKSAAALPDGVWRFVLPLNAMDTLSFQLHVEAGKYAIQNHTERIEIKEVRSTGDSLSLFLPWYDSELRGALNTAGHFAGNWWNRAKNDTYHIPFSASPNTTYRYAESTAQPEDFSGRWAVVFGEGEEVFDAVGVFEQHGQHLSGTFLTETGDYRFLEGGVQGNQAILSCFDGAHAFLFNLTLQDSVLSGDFLSGSHYKTSLKGHLDPTIELTSPYELTHIKDGHDFDFKFPNLNGDTVGLHDEALKDKIVLVQLMGTWCPNCVDESRYYGELHRKYKDKGVEVIAVAFERDEDFARSAARVENLKEKLNCDYEFLIGGTANKAANALEVPALNHLISYPTTIFVDAQKRVRKIHTGFYGPGTGAYYDKFKAETEDFLDLLIEEAKI